MRSPSLAVKVCPVTLTMGGSIEIGGENGKYIGYEDGCGVQGELIGVRAQRHELRNPDRSAQPLWEEWRPILSDIVGTLQFQ